MDVILVKDNFLTILSYINDKDKMNFLSTKKDFCKLKDSIYYKSKINYEKVKNLWYANKFTNLILDEKIILKGVTRLTFGFKFNQDIKYCISSLVTHLTFGYKFNQNIKDCIPQSVTHLTFGYKFNQDIKDCIPQSVTHLTFGCWFDQDIKDCIPPSVMFLNLDNNYSKEVPINENLKITKS